MNVKYTGKGRDVWTILIDSKGRGLCSVAGKHSLKRMVAHYTGARHIV